MALRAGILGYGLAGRILHSPLIADAGFDIRAISTSRTNEVRADFPNTTPMATAEEVIARDDVDVIMVCTPSFLHTEHALAALAAGKHVVIDKPFAATLADAKTVVEAAAKHKRVVSCFQNRRWDADFLTIRKLLNERTLGAIGTYEMRWDRYRPNIREPWRDGDVPGAGAVQDLGSHLIDQVLTLFGAPDWVQADLGRQRKGQVADDWFSILMGIGEMRISLGSSTLAADCARYFRILGNDGSFYKTGFDPQEPALKERRTLGPDFGLEDEAAWGRLTDATGKVRAIPTERGDWRSYYASFYRAAETGSAPPVPLTDTLKLIAIIEAVFESAKTGRRIDLKDYLGSRRV